MSDWAKRRHELLESVEETVQRELAERGIPISVAEQCGTAVADALCEEWQGQMILVPADYAWRLSQRDREIIAAKEEGESVNALAKRYNISYRAINKVLRRRASRAPVDAQLDLFGGA